ncbi:hypothetical protein D3C74_345610 [compost metagenome]
MAVTHLALDLGLGHERRDRVDDDDVDGARADQHVRDLEGLLARVRLRDEQRVGVDAQLLRVLGVQRVLGVDERRDAARALGAGHGVERDGRLAAGLGAVDLHDTAAREAADAERDVQGDRPGGDDLDRRATLVAEAHHRSLAEVAVDLCEGGFERLLAVCGCGHVGHLCVRGTEPCRSMFEAEDLRKPVSCPDGTCRH